MSSLSKKEVENLRASFLLSEAEVIKKAVNIRETKTDPLGEIAPSLLSADDIARYVDKTGMIYPFSFEKRKNIEKAKDGDAFGEIHRLKMASYEGQIGNSAYVFDLNKNEPRSILGTEDKTLLIPANSIVFVESNLHFRLPPYIAVRFNLQIRHVHRGLLLGTGPLVDPGFWGKLCIPVHNLTDQDYEIPRDEGLIWIEFTKTTSNPSLGDKPSNSDLENVKASLDKSSQPYKAVKNSFRTSLNGMTFLDIKNAPSKVGIRSSIQGALSKAEVAVEKAKSVQIQSRIYTFAGVVGVVLGVIAVWELHAAYQSDIASLVGDAGKEISELKLEMSHLTRDNETLVRTITELKTRIDMFENIIFPEN